MEALHARRDGPVLYVTLSRPETRNAFDATLIDELARTFTDVGDARCVVLAGDGPSFSAGANLNWMRESIELTSEENVADALRFRAVLEAVDGCPAPVIARVHGHALGGAAGLIACSDIAIAAPDTVFGFTEVRLGIVPAMISPYVLARIGPGPARRYFLTGERFDAVEAHRIGLVHELAEDLDAAVTRTVGAILAGGPEAVRAAKWLVLDRPDGAETARRIAERRTSEEGQEGLRAFLERREPAWRAGAAP
ncbi:MAG: enoyl-CoA hydratase-related protein [Gaiellales bacterium]